MNPAVISRRNGQARILLTGAAAALAAVTALTGGPARAAAVHPAGPTAAPAGTIRTIAGGVGGPAKATTVALTALGVDSQGGSLYVADGSTVRRIAANDQLTTPAGTGVGVGAADSGGLATESSLISDAVATDGAGNLVIAEHNHRQVSVAAAKTGTFFGRGMTAGHIYPVAGNGKFGFSASGTVALRARLNIPSGVAVDSHGNLVIAVSGYGNNRSTWARVQVVAATTGTFYGQAMTARHIYTVAGGGQTVGGDGGPATQASLGVEIGGVHMDPAGNLVFADTTLSRIRVVPVTSGTFYGHAMKAGDIYTVAGDGKPAFAGDGGLATEASIAFPADVAVDAAGDLAIADNGNQRARFVPATSSTFYGQAMKARHIYTVAGDGKLGFAGDGGPATAAELNYPRGVALDSAGNLVIADWANALIRLVAAHSGTFYDQAMTTGDIYTIGGVPGDDGTEFSGDDGPARHAELGNPTGIATDPAGDMLIADQGNGRVRMIPASSGTFFGQVMTAGDVYTVAGDGTLGFVGDGGPAVRAELYFPGDVALDRAGNLVIADTYNSRIRVVAAAAGTFYGQPMTVGHIYTVAGDGKAGSSGDGGPATSAELNHPDVVTLDAAGNLVISDTENNRVRVVAAAADTFYGHAMKAGHIYPIAGDGTAGFGGDGGPGASAALHWPYGVTVDGAGNLVFGDADNNRVRVVAAKTGTFYGVPMTAGNIDTVAGTGITGFSGDGGPGVHADLDFPAGMVATGKGLLIVDNRRVRMVTG